MDNGENPIPEDDAAKSPAQSSRIPIFKIKLGKKEEEEAKAAAAAVAVAVEEVIKSHYCKECNKSFHSGKALGGHMSSAHVQANKDYSYRKLSSKKRLSGLYSGSEGFKCRLCRKIFTSEKSLFGHMRCHPERLWRGMVPPDESKIGSEDSSEEEEEEAEVEEGEDSGRGVGFYNLKSWPTSNKRGRGQLTINPDVNRAHENDKGKDNSFAAGLQIIKLLKGDSGKQDNGPRPDLIESSDRGKGKLPEIQDQDSESSDDSISIDTNDELVFTAIQVLANARRENNYEKRAAAAAEGEESTVSPEKFRCSECGRLFPTHQALGGHRSSHNKFKMTVINTNECEEDTPRKPRKKRELPKKKKKIAKSNGDDGAYAFAFDLNMAPAEEKEEEENSSNHTTSSSLYLF